MAMIKNYFRPLLLYALLVSGFSLIYYLWYFQIIYNSIDKNPLLNLLSDKVYLFSIAKIVLETLAVSLILLGITIIQKFELTFLSIIYVVILAEYTFLFQALTEFAWLYYNKQTTDLNSLSLYSILDMEKEPNGRQAGAAGSSEVLVVCGLEPKLVR